jgi:hypothetical protein
MWRIGYTVKGSQIYPYECGNITVGEAELEKRDTESRRAAAKRLVDECVGPDGEVTDMWKIDNRREVRKNGKMEIR